MRLTGRFLSNYFKRYIEREMYSDVRRRTWRPVRGWKEITKKDWYYGEHRPWTSQFKEENAPGKKNPKVRVQPIKEWTLFKGDRVMVMCGRDKGKQGIINSTIKERNWCYVEGLNLEYKVQSPQPGTPPVCLADERPLLVTTQVKLVDPVDSEATDVEWRWTEKGERVRVSTRSGLIVPLPSGAQETEDFVMPNSYVECDRDTREKDVTEVTFQPKLCSFDEDIMESMGIKEERKPGQVYWY